MSKPMLSRRMLRSSQSGAALLLALVVLTLIMLVGVASLKQGVTQARIASNTNAAGIAFQAADTAVENAFENFVVSGGNARNSILYALSSATQVSRCVGEAQGDDCARLEGTGEVYSSSVSTHADVPDRPVTGSSTNILAWRFYQIVGTGRAGADAFASVSNTQEFANKEVATSDDVFEEYGSMQAGSAP